MDRVAEAAEIDEKVAAAVEDCTGKKVEVERRREGGRVGACKGSSMREGQLGQSSTGDGYDEKFALRQRGSELLGHPRAHFLAVGKGEHQLWAANARRLGKPS
jgi:hypothetical protein